MIALDVHSEAPLVSDSESWIGVTHKRQRSDSATFSDVASDEQVNSRHRAKRQKDATHPERYVCHSGDLRLELEANYELFILHTVRVQV